MRIKKVLRPTNDPTTKDTIRLEEERIAGIAAVVTKMRTPISRTPFAAACSFGGPHDYVEDLSADEINRPTAKRMPPVRRMACERDGTDTLYGLTLYGLTLYGLT